MSVAMQEFVSINPLDDVNEMTNAADVDGAGVIEVDFGAPPAGFGWLIDGIIIITNAAAGLVLTLYSGGSKGDASLSNVRDGAAFGTSGIIRGDYVNGLYVAPGRRFRARVTGAAAGTRMEITVQVRLRKKS